MQEISLKKIKVLNLYAGIGGNRKLWPNELIEVTAIELNPKIAELYKTSFPQDKVLITDAHQYLLEHYKEFDFIWSSPPCITHSGMNNFLNAQGIIRFPDMSLWEEIIFLEHFFKGKWVVENVASMYYKPLIKPIRVSRHFFWSNFNFPASNLFKTKIGTFNRQASVFCQKMTTKTQIERNTLNPEIGLMIFKSAFKFKQKLLTTM